MMQAAMTKRRRLGWWKEFLLISIPIAAIILLCFPDMACSFRLVPPASLRADRARSTAGTIPLADQARRLTPHFESAFASALRAYAVLGAGAGYRIVARAVLARAELRLRDRDVDDCRRRGYSCA